MRISQPKSEVFLAFARCSGVPGIKPAAVREAMARRPQFAMVYPAVPKESHRLPLRVPGEPAGRGVAGRRSKS